jgi:hypothetical protein
MTNNKWPGKPGVPLNPDMREKLEYALAMHFSSNRMPHMSGDPRNRLSSLQRRNMEDAVTSILEVIGPILTPAEVEARVATAHKEWLAELNHDTDQLMEEARLGGLEEGARWHDEQAAEAQRLSDLKVSALDSKVWGDYAQNHREYAAAIRALKGEGND